MILHTSNKGDLMEEIAYMRDERVEKSKAGNHCHP
jgi:hypothetical protein